MKRVIKSSHNITKRYADKPNEQLASMLGISSWGNSGVSLMPVSEGKWNFKIVDRYRRLDNDADYVADLKKIGAKYITVRYGDIYFYFDLSKLQADYEAKEAEYSAAYNDALTSFDVTAYKPDNATIKKLMDYRAKGSTVNVKSIKAIDKLITYYYGAKLLGWSELANSIRKRLGYEYEDEMSAINKQVAANPEYSDSRNADDIELGLGNSNNLFTFDQRSAKGKVSCWLPKKLLNWFIQNNVPVHFGKRTPGGRYDRNGSQWSEIEHLTIFPGTPDEFNYDIVVHTNERADGSIPNTYTGDGTDERVSIAKVIEDLDARIN